MKLIQDGDVSDIGKSYLVDHRAELLIKRQIFF